MKISKKILVGLIVLFGYLIYRLLFCYTLVTIPFSDDIKHKIGEVSYFPTIIINPFKVDSIKSRITEYVKYDMLDESNVLEGYFSLLGDYYQEYKTEYRRNVNQGHLEIISIKNERGLVHIMTSSKNRNMIMVFVFENNRVLTYY